MKGIEKPAFGVLVAICSCHLINDMLQSLLVATYPTLKAEFHLSFTQIGLVTLAYQLTASLLQPVVGLYADRKPTPFSLPGGTLFTFAGLMVIASARSYGTLLAGACVLGMGSSVFHPESSRVARMASGGRPGLAQSLFQVGGNAGSALGPLAAAIVVLRWGRRGMGAFSFVALISTCILVGVGFWYRRHGLQRLAASGAAPRGSRPSERLSGARVRASIAVLMALIFSKFVYLAGFTSYYTFYLMHRFSVPVADAQMHRLRDMGITVIADLCHFGVPSWLGGFQDEAFPALFAAYAGAFARHLRPPLRPRAALRLMIAKWHSGRSGSMH